MVALEVVELEELPPEPMAVLAAAVLMIPKTLLVEQETLLQQTQAKAITVALLVAVVLHSPEVVVVEQGRLELLEHLVEPEAMVLLPL